MMTKNYSVKNMSNTDVSETGLQHKQWYPDLLVTSEAVRKEAKKEYRTFLLPLL